MNSRHEGMGMAGDVCLVTSSWQGGESWREEPWVAMQVIMQGGLPWTGSSQTRTSAMKPGRSGAQVCGGGLGSS